MRGFGAVAADLGLSADPQIDAGERTEIVAIFVKCEPSRDGRIRGEPHTMWNDGDIDAQRHIRAAVGAIAAGVLRGYSASSFPAAPAPGT